MNDDESAKAFRLIACDRDGQPLQNLGDLPQTIRDNCEGTAALYRKTGFMPPWIGYIAVYDGAVVGGGAFVGPPQQNRVEIAYFTLPEHEGKGMASLSAGALVRLAREADPSIELFAKTLPNPNASSRILSRLGFNRIGLVEDDGIGEAWGWILPAHSTPPAA